MRLRKIRILLTKTIERILAIDTCSLPNRSITRNAYYGDCIPYESTDYWMIGRFIEPLMPSSTDVVFDIGCGMGRVLCVFSRLGVKECIGIEISPELALIAERNIETLRGKKSPIKIRLGDASKEDYSGGTIYWLFNPFGAQTLEAVLDQIEKSLVNNPRYIRLAYLNPVHDSVLLQRKWLIRSDHRSFRWCKTKASYWINCLWTGNDV